MQVGDKVRVNETVYGGENLTIGDMAMIGREGVIAKLPKSQGYYIEVMLYGEDTPDMFYESELDAI